MLLIFSIGDYPILLENDMVILAGFGNPLLDLTVKVGCRQLLQKYNLKEDDQCEIDEVVMTSLLKDIKK